MQTQMDYTVLARWGGIGFFFQKEKKYIMLGTIFEENVSNIYTYQYLFIFFCQNMIV